VNSSRNRLFCRIANNENQSLHKILLNKPTTKVGVVTGVIEEHAITIIVQLYCVACCQSQGGAQGNDIPTSRSTLISISTTKSGAVYLKINVQKVEE